MEILLLRLARAIVGEESCRCQPLNDPSRSVFSPVAASRKTPGKLLMFVPLEGGYQPLVQLYKYIAHLFKINANIALQLKEYLL